MNAPLQCTADAPALSGILESALYVSDLALAEIFYTRVLHLQKIFTVPGRQLVFRSASSILLIFQPDQTERDPVTINGGQIPLHGARGAGHVAFRVDREQLGPWRERLKIAQVPIESEVAWPNGAHSIYFRDPAGNSLEFATPDMWQGLSPSS